ncbi:MAG: murein biosynthesis integral membrane protein MurJ [Actinomycetota bacterium]
MIRRLLGGSGSNLVAAGILLSRIAGLVREVVLGVALGGVGPVADAFRFAMRLPNLLQNLLGEGALSASFIPVYARTLTEGDEGDADELAGVIATLLAATTAVLVALGVLLARPLVLVFTSWDNDPEQVDLAVTLVRITTVGLGFLVLSAWCLGVLNSHRRFFLPYVAPVLWNLAQIVVLLVAIGLDWDASRAAVALAWAVVAGGVLQFGVQLPTVLRLSPKLKAGFARSAGVDDVLSRFAPAVGSRGVVQISSFVDTFLAGTLVFGAFSAYAPALVLYLLPISLFGFSVAAAELAEMSRRAGTEAVVTRRITPALRRVVLPAGFVTAAYLAAGRPLVDALYGWVSRLAGRGFDAEGITAVGLVLSAFALGLPAAMTARITQNTLYSMGEVRGPAVIAVVRLAVSVVVSVVLMLQLDWLFVADGTTIERFGDVPHWPLWESVPDVRRLDSDAPPHLGAVGLALGASAAAWTEWLLLRRLLRRRLGRPVRSGWMRIVALAATVSGLAMAVIANLGLPSPIDAVVIVVVGAGIYGGALWMQGVRGMPQLASES